jgi:hypothetical protein
VIVLGDINDFEFSQTVELLEGGVLTTLMDTLAKAERYSYVFEGNSQVLDQILMSNPLLRSFPVDYAHHPVGVHLRQRNPRRGSCQQLEPGGAVVAGPLRFRLPRALRPLANEASGHPGQSSPCGRAGDHRCKVRAESRPRPAVPATCP